MRCLERAVLMFEEDAAVPAGLKPLMLETVLSRPILSWVCDRLRTEGVQRLFAVCGPRFAEEARGLLPPEAQVSEQWTELEAFLDTDEPVLVLPRAAFPMEQAGPGFAYAAPGRELRDQQRAGGGAGFRLAAGLRAGDRGGDRGAAAAGKGPGREPVRERSEFVRPAGAAGQKIK